MIASQAGIISSRRKKINPTEFNNFRYTKVEYDNPVLFELSPPASRYSFVARHIYNYNKTTNSFEFLGTQKAQRLKKERFLNFVNQIVIQGFSEGNVNGTYTRLNPNDQYLISSNNGYYINAGNPAQEFINEWILIADYAEIAYIYSDYISIIDQSYSYDNTPFAVYNAYYSYYPIDNTTVKKANENQIYSTIEPDIGREQLEPNYNFNINTSNIFDKKNLAHNQKVFIDVRWIRFVDERRKNEIYEYYDENSEQWITVNWWLDHTEGGLMMNNRKGHIYRAGVLIEKDNIIDSMIHFVDLENAHYMNASHKVNL